jgi:hypothetical protein
VDRDLARAGPLRSRLPSAAAARRAELKVTIYPNPAWLSSVGIGIKIDGNATSYFGEVYDMQGRRLRKFSGVGNQGVVWTAAPTRAIWCVRGCTSSGSNRAANPRRRA